MTNTNAARETVTKQNKAKMKTPADFIDSGVAHVITANDEGNFDFITLEAEQGDPGISLFLQLDALSKQVGTPISSRIYVSPVTARFFLSRNDDNRVRSETNLAKYKMDIIEGRWLENGDGIAISKCGFLNNGQHRLVAITQTGFTLPMTITVGLERDARMTNDTNLPKTASNLAKMQGTENPGMTVAAARNVRAYQEEGTLAKRRGREVSTSRILAYMAEDPSIEESAAWAKTLKNNKHIPKAHIAFYHNIFTKHNPEKGAEFVKVMVTGMEEVIIPATETSEEQREMRGLMQGDPRLTARDRLSKLEKEYNEFHYRAEIVFRAWNAWIEGRQINQIVVKNQLPKLS